MKTGRKMHLDRAPGVAWCGVFTAPPTFGVDGQWAVSTAEQFATVSAAHACAKCRTTRDAAIPQIVAAAPTIEAAAAAAGRPMAQRPAFDDLAYDNNFGEDGAAPKLSKVQRMKLRGVS